MKRLFVSLAAVTLVAGIAQARAEDSSAVPLQHGSYFAIAAGGNAISDGNALDVNRVPEAIKFAFHDGPVFSVSGGYKWESGLRTELEGSYRSNGVKDFDSSANALTGHQNDFSFMTNILYDINTKTRLTPYFGAGVGVAMVSWKKFSSASSGLIIDNGGSSARFAIQAIGGFAYALGSQWEATVDFRYKGSNGHEFTGVMPVDSISGFKLRDMSVMAGLRYDLGS